MTSARDAILPNHETREPHPPMKLKPISVCLASLVALALATWHGPNPVGFLRLGTQADYVTLAGITRRTIVSEPGGPTVIELHDIPEGTLHLAVSAAASDGSTTPPSPLSCTARLRYLTGQTRTLATVVVDPSQPRWNEARVPLRPLNTGHLLLDCDPGIDTGAVVEWAQPLFVPRRARAHPPLVVLISLDALRADYVEGFGGAPGTTPALRRLGEEGIRFVEATSDGTWTLHSHFAMLFSRLYGFPVMTKPLTSLAQAFADQGFETAALTGGGFMSPDFNFHLGFDRLVQHDARDHEGADVKALPEIVNDAAELVESFASVPLFLFVHTYAVHQQTPIEGQWKREVGEFRPFQPTPQQVEDTRRFYGDLVRETDRVLAPFFERLRVLARHRSVLVLVTSDHGEAFGEHANFRHGWDLPSIRLYDELIRVPFIAWNLRGIPGGRVSRRPVMLSDIAPSLLSSHRITPPPSMLGTDLSALWAGAAQDASSGLPRARNPARSVSHTHASWSLRDASYKLIVHMGESGIDTFELYDLGRDPGEHSDVAAQRPLLVGRLRDELLALLPQLDIAVVEGGKAAPRCPLCEWSDISAFFSHGLADGSAPVEAGDLAPETAERLRALGYLN